MLTLHTLSGTTEVTLMIISEKEKKKKKKSWLSVLLTLWGYNACTKSQSQNISNLIVVSHNSA